MDCGGIDGHEGAGVRDGQRKSREDSGAGERARGRGRVFAGRKNPGGRREYAALALVDGDLGKTADDGLAAGPDTHLPVEALGPDVLLAFSQDGKWLAVELSHEGRGQVRVWEAAKGRQVLDNLGDKVPFFARGGSLLLTARKDRGDLFAWDATSEKEIPLPICHTDRIRAITGGEQGKPLWTSGDDDRIVKWAQK